MELQKQKKTSKIINSTENTASSSVPFHRNDFTNSPENTDNLINSFTLKIFQNIPNASEESFIKLLAKWVFESLVTHVVTNKLLNLLKQFGHSELPTTYNALIKKLDLDQFNYKIDNISDMQYVYLDLIRII